MAEQLWGGRFSKSTDEMINDFQASIDFDKRMYAEDIAGSIAHATMLAKVGIISEADRDAIIAGLKDIYVEEFGDREFIHGKNDRKLKGILKSRCEKQGMLYKQDDIFDYVYEFPSKTIQSKLI